MNRIEQDSARQPIIPSCILANKSGQKLGVVLIDEQTLTIKVSLEDNHILLSKGDNYYLYIDIVSYFHKENRLPEL